jgi:hypothetical protein
MASPIKAVKQYLDCQLIDNPWATSNKVFAG